VYYIFPRSGGPSIQFLGGGVFEEAGLSFIRPGSISHYPTYWVGRNTAKAPTALVKTYNVLVKSVKESSKRIKPGKCVYWLGQGAEQALRQGAKLVGHQKLSTRQLLDTL
jgi:hypothetical protein